LLPSGVIARFDPERSVESLELLGPELGAEVPVGRGQLRMAEEVAYEYGVIGAGDETAGGVPESVKANRSQPGLQAFL
jgi:hypothetical protein